MFLTGCTPLNSHKVWVNPEPPSERTVRLFPLDEERIRQKDRGLVGAAA
jgi:hypothetical protein